MSDTVRAKRAEIKLGDETIEVFQLPNGNYTLSQTQVAKVVGKSEDSFRRFLKSPQFKIFAFSHELDTKRLLVEGNNQSINPIPIRIAIKYWVKETLAKNESAAKLISACAEESIQRRADSVFGISRTEDQYNKLLKNNFRGLQSFSKEFADLDAHSLSSEIFSDQTYDSIRPLLRGNLRYPINGMTEDEFRDDLASLSSRTTKWKLKIEDELEFEFDDKREYSYPDLTSEAFLCSADLDGSQQKVVFLFECKNPIVTISHVKECLYDRKYLEAAREKYDTPHIFLFFVAPYGGEPTLFRYMHGGRLSPDDLAYIRIITVKDMAIFLKSQIEINNPVKKAEITKLYQKLLNYQTNHQSLNP